MNAALLEATDPRGFLLKHLNAGVRPDGRADPPFSSRKISATSSEGKSTVRIGENCATCVVHPLLGEPLSSMPRQGRLTVSVDLPPAADQSRRQAQQVSSWVATKVGSILQMGPEVFDPSQLCVVEGQVVWQLHLVITVLSVDGSLMDVCMRAAVEALQSVQLPALFAGEALSDRAADVNIASITTAPMGRELTQAHGVVMGSIPGSTTLALLSDDKTWLLPDPTASEEQACGGAVIIVVTYVKGTRKGPSPTVLSYLPSFDGDADIPPTFLEDDAVHMALKIRGATVEKKD
ncbi:Exosome complex exonuclease RRP43, putative [Perkinsus marinus ATCC 50983]|uniref:Ribosomal RNA-processing protein 43 n=1 Tax=Perkinsus marinus (strain ATCC 50983 / TXsc) TaxID=423536 RepID=C5LR20_PERM5|nr:Exosome complex exonuclease RRP43, putative [Perkinsus marinus ATCC 50983]EER00905.1 Exosome complex exonuclease RRP43, putative [Perkinsus marinus ATCC 50983]|eukprot:XP_002768187.1 Exosome complex exonuclease RRP43, putative [Perkinsus marinus ATCC 50983]